MSREFYVPSKVICGRGGVLDAVPGFKALGKKALIVTGTTVVTLDCFKQLTAALKDNGIEYAVFTGITGEPDDRMIDEGIRAFKENGCDFLIGIGGGSPLDSIKAIGAMSQLGGKITDFIGKPIEGDFPKMVAIPTTAGTGSEATKFTIITDSQKGIKMLLAGNSLIPDIAIIDPEYVVTAPKSITCATGLDALTHAIESYTSRKRQPLTDTVSLSAVKRIIKNLPVAYNDGSNIEAREEMSIAALEAGIAINNASVTIVHGMSRPIGALFHVPHGISNAMLLKNCLKFALPGAYPRFATLARETGASDSKDDVTAANAFIKTVEELCRVCEVPTLEQYGIDREKFFSLIDKMSDDAIASGSPSNTMREVTKADIVEIYKSLWD